jgi:hypothetical protein
LLNEEFRDDEMRLGKEIEGSLKGLPGNLFSVLGEPAIGEAAGVDVEDQSKSFPTAFDGDCI